MAKVFLPAKSKIPHVMQGDQEVTLKNFGSKWALAEVLAGELSIILDDEVTKYQLEDGFEYAIYKKELLKIDRSRNRVLLVTDLDGTMVGENNQIMEDYETFIKFWIKFYEFNGSKLVYNTGRLIDEYIRDQHLFYEPDLAVLLLGNYAYKFDKNGQPVLLDSFFEFLHQSKTHDWDVKAYYEEIIQKFPFLKDYFIQFDVDNLFFKLPSTLMSEYERSIISYCKNKEKRVIEGKCMIAKVIITSQGEKDVKLLEIIPAYSGKGLAVKYAQSLLGFIDEETFTAGDSLNDRHAFKTKDVKGVIVANSEITLIDWFNKKPRDNIYLSNEKWGLGVIDLLNKFSIRENSSTVFFYREKPDLIQIYENENEIEYKTFKQKWFYFVTDSKEFSIAGQTFTLPTSGRYAIYKNELLEIKRNLFNILLVSDLDGTLIHSSAEGMQFYHDFIKFWIQYYEFNSSVLVHNTGRNLPDYNQESENFFRPDLLLLCLSNFAYTLSSDLSQLEDPFFIPFKNSIPKHDWDSILLTEILKQKFNLKNENFQRIYDTYILAKVDSKLVKKRFKEIKELVQNKDNVCINGIVFKGKVRMLKLGMMGKRFLEIIPLFVGKGFGVRYAQRKYSFDDSCTFAAGDSPNDIDSLKLSVWGIAMENSEEMLMEWVKKKERSHLVVSNGKWARGLKNELEKRIVY